MIFGRVKGTAALLVVLMTGGACGLAGKSGEEAKRLPRVDEQTLNAGLDAFFAEVIKGLGASKPAQSPAASPDSCGPDNEVREREDGDYSPYQMAYFSNIEKVPENELAPTIERLREHARQRGWVITRFRPKADGRQNTHLTGHDPKTGNGFSAEALHDGRRIVISVGSPCVRAPWDVR